MTLPRRCARVLLRSATLLRLQWPLWSATAADVARGEEIVQGKCFICRGAAGESSSPVFPPAGGAERRVADPELAQMGRFTPCTQKAISSLSGM